MTYNIRIEDWLPGGSGSADYKGLNIDCFVPGSQLYFKDYCYVKTTEDLSSAYKDVKVVSEEEYQAAYEELNNQSSNYIDPLEELRTENAELKQAIAELTMMIAAPIGGDGR